MCPAFLCVLRSYAFCAGTNWRLCVRVPMLSAQGLTGDDVSCVHMLSAQGLTGDDVSCVPMCPAFICVLRSYVSCVPMCPAFLCFCMFWNLAQVRENIVMC